MIKNLQNYLENLPCHSAWKRGVRDYAVDLLENLDGKTAEDISDATLLEEALLSGAKNWSLYSWGGCALIYNGDIAKALCTPSEFKRSKQGQNPPNRHEEWLDVQARALRQAAKMVEQAAANTIWKK